MIENFSLQEQWIKERQDKELFNILEECITFITSIPTDVLSEGPIDEGSDKVTRRIEYQGKKIEYTISLSEDICYFQLGGEDGAANNFLSEPFWGLHAYVVVLRAEPQKWNLSIEVSYIKDGDIFNYVMPLRESDIKWLCVIFHWNRKRAKLDANWDNIEFVISMEDFPKMFKNNINNVKNMMNSKASNGFIQLDSFMDLSAFDDTIR